jgi:hypothetical protein
MRDPGYQGSFDHPVRSFLIGVALLALLFGGFVIGIEASSQPSASGGTRTLTVGGQRLRVVTVQQPVVRTTIGRATTIVRLLGSGRTAAVVKTNGSTLVGYLSAHRGPIVASSAFRQAGTIYLPSPVTITETITETVTQTVTETTGTTDGGTTTDTTAP